MRLFLDYIMQDAYVLYDNNSLLVSLKRYCFGISYRVTIQMRILQYLSSRNSKITKMLMKIIAKIYNIRNEKLGIYLPYETQIGPGIYFPHNFPVVVHYASKIGKNCIIHPNVQIGSTRGKEGVPIIGDNCFLGNGCHIIGNPKIGDWVFISPGAFVCKDVPDGSVVGYGLNNIISNKGKQEVSRYLTEIQLKQ